MSGCAKKPYLHETLQDYAQRLSNVLDVSHEISFQQSPKQKPEQKKVKNGETLSPAQQHSSQSIKLRDFYNLPDCGIKPLIAERNTTLGKLQAPSQRYIYEVQLVKALKKCMAMAEKEDVEALKVILSAKQEDLLNAWQVLIFDSKELDLATASKTVHFSPSENHDFALLSWQQLVNYSPEKTADIDEAGLGELESHLKTISDYKSPAKLLNDSHLITSWLPQITQFLDNQTSHFTCVSRKEKQKVEYLRNVFHLFFVEKIQPLTSNMNKWYYKLEPVLESLGHPLVQGGNANSLKQQKTRYDSSLKRHVQFWQKLFKRCGVSPLA